MIQSVPKSNAFPNHVLILVDQRANRMIISHKKGIIFWLFMYLFCCFSSGYTFVMIVYNEYLEPFDYFYNPLHSASTLVYSRLLFCIFLKISLSSLHNDSCLDARIVEHSRDTCMANTWSSLSEFMVRHHQRTFILRGVFRGIAHFFL